MTQPREALPLFHEPGLRVHTRSPEYFAYWAGCSAGYDGQPCRYADADERVVAYWRDGWKLGHLFRPRFGQVHRRSHPGATRTPQAGGNANVNITRWLQEHRAKFGVK